MEVGTCVNNVRMCSEKESRAKKKCSLGKGFLSTLWLFLESSVWKPACQIGTENLIQPSKQKGSIGVVLAKQCQNLGLTFKQCEGKSHRVCNAYGWKIRTLHQLYSFVASALYSDS